MSLVPNAARNRTVFIVNQEMPTVIVSRYHVAPVDQVTFPNRAIFQIDFAAKSLHLR